MVKKHVYRILFISWVALITILSLFSFPGLEIDNGIRIPHADKIVHFVFYFVLVVLGFFFLKEKANNNFNLSRTIFKILVFAILYGILIEALQFTMSYGRAAEILDVLANSIGAIFASLLIKKYFSLTDKLK